MTAAPSAAYWRLAALLALACAAGCARVDATPDFQRAAQGVADRIGVEDVYDPTAEAMVESKVSALLAGGLTVDKAVRVALLNNKAFQSLFQAIGASRADVVQSGLLSNPTLTFTVRFPEGGGRSDVVAGFGQEIANLWQIPIRKRIAQSDLDQAILTALNRGVELTAEVRTRAYQVLGLERAEANAHETLELAERAVSLANERFGAGEVSQLDVALVRGRMLEIRQSLITIRRDLHAAQVALAQSLGLTRWRAPWRLVDTLGAPVAADYDEEALIELAMQQRFDVRLSAAQVESAEGALLREAARIFPSVIVGMELERSADRTLPGRKILADTARGTVAAGALTAPTIQSRGDRRRARSQLIDSIFGPSISLTLPIWDQNQAQIAKVRYNVLRLRKDYEDLADAVARQVREAVVRARAGVELVQFYHDEAIPLATQNLENARRLYRSGEQSVVVLIEAEESLIVQRRGYVDAIRDAAMAQAELERAVGGRAPPPPATMPATQPAASGPAATQPATQPPR